MIRNTIKRYDDWGFDPRDGSSGAPERQHVPKQPFRPRSKQVRKAMRGKLGRKTTRTRA